MLSVLVAGRWGLDIKGEFVTVDHGVIISRAPTYPLITHNSCCKISRRLSAFRSLDHSRYAEYRMARVAEPAVPAVAAMAEAKHVAEEKAADRQR